MLPFSLKKGDCTGCSACYAVCPVHCIQMVQDEEGFLYPKASEDCIGCKKCEKICPKQSKPYTDTVEKKAFAARTKYEDIWKRSASGGAFSEICRAFGDDETLIVGAAWDGFSVRHIGVTGLDRITPLCKSKYIASDPGDTFAEIKEHLGKDKKAVFCGTPCQVAGLKAYLGHGYEKLLLIDLICHGVGSPTVFQTCLSVMEKQLSEQITSYEFRTKRKTHETDYLTKVSTKQGSTETYLTNDSYIQLFLKQQCLRPSCGENCIYRDENRQGDITIADFKGLGHVFPELAGTKHNYSAVVTNTEKGSKLIPVLAGSMEMHACAVDDIKKYNPLFCRQTFFAEDRDRFFAEFISNPKETVERWTSPATVYKRGLKRKAYDALPVMVRTFIWRLVHKA